ncbi:prepilin peptidase [Alkalilacustris brevis]|uniref:prepilin peptidase n=1 Tax=Alkalilacustris brevis TaxID=2026338 RepID=UPI000E0E08C9|nr:prepilin peptidase [Alkalilacustris brevis]
MLVLPASAALWFLPAALPIAYWVAWSDMKSMRIPNRAVLALLGVYLLIGPLVLPLESWAWGWAHFAVILVIGFVLSAGGMIGAGDAKFAAAMAPFVALGDVALFLPLFAAMLLAAFVTHRALRAVPQVRALAPHWESWERREFPMGLALGGALALYLVLAASLGQ